jgi:hypothetical protein
MAASFHGTNYGPKNQPQSDPDRDIIKRRPKSRSERHAKANKFHTHSIPPMSEVQHRPKSAKASNRVIPNRESVRNGGNRRQGWPIIGP